MDSSSFLKGLLEDKIFISIFVFIFSVLYVNTAILFLKKRRFRRTKNKSLFFETIKEGLLKHTIVGFEDVKNIYSGCTGVNVDEITSFSTLNRWLRELSVKLHSECSAEKLSDENLLSLVGKINEFLKQSIVVSPYADLPNYERNLFDDIEVYMENNDTLSMKRKLSELSASTITRVSILEKLKISNKWSKGFAIVGFLLTVTSTIITFLN